MKNTKEYLRYDNLIKKNKELYYIVIFKVVKFVMLSKLKLVSLNSKKNNTFYYFFNKKSKSSKLYNLQYLGKAYDLIGS